VSFILIPDRDPDDAVLRGLELVDSTPTPTGVLICTDRAVRRT